MHRPITTGGTIALFCFLNDGANHCFSLAIKKLFREHRCPVSSALRFAGWIARLSWMAWLTRAAPSLIAVIT
jgi:hypothetical protein